MRARGFTLIEVVVAMAILGILLALAAPVFAQWISNARVRSLAESVQNGLRQARMEATRLNRPVSFIFSSSSAPGCSSSGARSASTSGTHWLICVESDVAVDPTVTPTPVTANAVPGNATISSDFSTVTFNAMGRTDRDEDAEINIGQSGETCEKEGGNARCLRVLLSPGGKVRMCDPKLDSSSPAGCPED